MKKKRNIYIYNIYMCVCVCIYGAIGVWAGKAIKTSSSLSFVAAAARILSLLSLGAETFLLGGGDHYKSHALFSEKATWQFSSLSRYTTHSVSIVLTMIMFVLKKIKNVSFERSLVYSGVINRRRSTGRFLVCTLYIHTRMCVFIYEHFRFSGVANVFNT